MTTIKNYTTLKQPIVIKRIIESLTTIKNYTTLKLVAFLYLRKISLTTIKNYTTLKRISLIVSVCVAFDYHKELHYSQTPTVPAARNE